MSEHVLPASVRVALWATAALNGQVDRAVVPSRAMPDLDDCSGLSEQLELWAGLGEKAVFVALPRPGDLVGMPQAEVEGLAAATAAGECVFVAGVGGVAVPSIEAFGPPGDQGWAARWRAYSADPVPVHRIEALDLGQTEFALRRELAGRTAELVSAGAPPLAAAAGERSVRGRLDDRLGGSWGLPTGLPPRVLRVVDLAGGALALADAGLDPEMFSVDATSTVRRSHVLHGLRDAASRALADATNVGVLHLAGWR